MYRMISSVVRPDLECKHSHVTFDFRKLNSIGLGGIAVLSNVIEYLRSRGATVEFEYLTDCGAKHYFDKLGFTRIYAPEFAPDNTHRDRDVLPLTLVSKDRVYDYLFNKLIPWMRTHLKVNYRSELGSVQASLQEIFNNIIDHSKVEIGCACGIYSRDKNFIKLCISDFGVGIPANVRKQDPSIKSDALSLAKACQHGFTTRSTPRNSGVGLHVLNKNTVYLNSGELAIHSGQGIYRSHKIDDRIYTRPQIAEGFYPGTTIFLIFPVDKFVPDEIDAPFEWED
ncbi:MAG TPA: hypothetical protein DD666_00670 [Advenella kashmirensis]|uniref:Uncharacterized protein n=1 Tax=Advenella kashmirensis TaxID=310575 RepID=A0A356LAD5_9BURK|nr:hypothetical protein [Advenella kashmirensis]